MQDFRKLEVWHQAHAHTLAVRKATNGFPRSGYSSLKLQLTRAAESIPYNIVEGCGASTRKEFARFLDISIKSSSETEYQLQLAYDYGVIKEKHWKELSDETIIIRKRLYRLKKKIDPD
ncbi:MAG TPA: four helix bundle protein [Gemmatimonadaceae bacterium]|nr:four helix bundle protein [Gemmatimonadaceae bacterium]